MNYISKLDIPIREDIHRIQKWNAKYFPIRWNCSHEERNEFEKYDLENNIRKDVKVLQEEFKDLNLTYSIGGRYLMIYFQMDG